MNENNVFFKFSSIIRWLTKWLNGILRSRFRSRFKYLRKSVSLVAKKSSGRIAPKNTPWLRLKETTPFPNKIGLIAKFKFTDTGATDEAAGTALTAGYG